MTLETFKPGLTGRDILMPRTRSAVSDWLKSEPKSHEDLPIVAICQEFFCEPVEDVDPARDPVQLLSFEHLSVRSSHITPIARHNHGYGKMWSGELTDDHMVGFRDPHFMLTHDDTFLRLINSDLMVLTDPGGSIVRFYHLAHGSMMMSTELVSRMTPEEGDKSEWQGALITAIFPRAESHHEILTRTAQVQQMNDLIWPFFCSASDNFEALKPEQIPIDFGKFA